MSFSSGIGNQLPAHLHEVQVRWDEGQERDCEGQEFVNRYDFFVVIPHVRIRFAQQSPHGPLSFCFPDHADQAALRHLRGTFEDGAVVLYELLACQDVNGHRGDELLKVMKELTGRLLMFALALLAAAEGRRTLAVRSEVCTGVAAACAAL